MSAAHLRLGFLATAVLAIALAGCGGSSSGSGVSEEEASVLIEHVSGVEKATCISTEQGGRGFNCKVMRYGSPIKMGITVAESGETFYVGHCDLVQNGAQGVPEKNPCAGLG